MKFRRTVGKTNLVVGMDEDTGLAIRKRFGVGDVIEVESAKDLVDPKNWEPIGAEEVEEEPTADEPTDEPTDTDESAGDDDSAGEDADPADDSDKDEPEADEVPDYELSHKGGGYYDIINNTTGKPVNDKALKKSEAVIKCDELNGVA